MERVGPLADDPAVRAALGTWVSDQVLDAVDPEKLFVEALPERGRLLAGPLAGAVDEFVRARVDRFLASDRFEKLWLEANELAHRAAVRVIRGESDALTTQGDKVVINLVPVIDAALADLGSASPELLGRQVDLPDLSVDDLPKDAIPRLEQALGINLGDNFGQFVVYDHGRLTALQDGIDRARRWLFGLSALTVVALAGALWISDRRRRTLLQMLVGLAIGVAVIRRLGLRGQRELLAAIPDEVNRAAAAAASDAFLDPLLAVTQTILIGLALVAAVAVLTGPYAWAVRIRHRLALLRTGALTPGVTTAWVGAHRGALKVGGLALALLVLLAFNLSFLGVVVLGLAVAGGGIVLGRVIPTG
jgi:hypothetical protein